MAVEPLIVSLWKGKDRQGFLCSGLLLTGQYILTVRHAFADWPADTPVFVRLIPGVDGDVGARLVQFHPERDAAILQLDTPVGDVKTPNLMTRADKPYDGLPAILRVIDPDTYNRSTPSNYSIASYDHGAGEFVISPENARGHSGGVVEVGGKIVALLCRRAIGDPLCRAVSIHGIWPWIAQVTGMASMAPGPMAPAPSSGKLTSGAVTREMPSASSAIKCQSPAVQGSRRFRVALSFAGAQKAFIQDIAEELARTFGKDGVFYYPWYEHETNDVGSLALQLPDFYLHQSDLTVPFISKEYVQSKPCAAEWRSVVELIYTWQNRRLMVFRFDQTPIQGLHSYDCYSEVDERSASEIAALIVRRWEHNTGIATAQRGASDPDQAFEALREIVGERVLERLKMPALQKLRTEGEFLVGHEDPTGPADVTTLVDGLHRATKRCIPIWRREFNETPGALDGVRQECRLLLGELLKLGVSKDLIAQQMGELASTAPERIMLSCRRIGTAVAIYCALRDLPLLFSEVIEEGFDVSDSSVIDLDGLAMGPGQDARDDVCNALWLAVRGKSPALQTWTGDHLKSLKAYIAQHWRRDRKWYLLTTGIANAGDTRATYDEIAREMSIGLVIRSAREPCDLLTIGEEDLVALVCEYLQLLETL